MSWGKWAAKNAASVDWSQFEDWKTRFLSALCHEIGMGVRISDARLRAFFKSGPTVRNDPGGAAWGRAPTYFAVEIARSAAIEAIEMADVEPPSDDELDAYYARIEQEEQGVKNGL